MGNEPLLSGALPGEKVMMSFGFAARKRLSARTRFSFEASDVQWPARSLTIDADYYYYKLHTC